MIDFDLSKIPYSGKLPEAEQLEFERRGSVVDDSNDPPVVFGNNVMIIYRVLYALEHKKKIDYMSLVLGPDRLKTKRWEWLEVIERLSKEGLISGIRIFEDITGETNVDIENAKITLKGAQYLKENSAMVKIGRIATNVISISKNI